MIVGTAASLFWADTNRHISTPYLAKQLALAKVNARHATSEVTSLIPLNSFIFQVP
jgi:hypothetical protein